MLYLKVCKKKSPLLVWGLDRKICPSWSLFVITRQASWFQSVVLETHFSISPSHSWYILIYQLPLIHVLTALLHVDLINVDYLMACAFIRSSWHCTFLWHRQWHWIDTKLEHDVIIASLKSESTCELINRIAGSRFLYQVYQARLQERTLNRSASLAMSTSILEALRCKLDIKRHSPSILYFLTWACS